MDTVCRKNNKSVVASLSLDSSKGAIHTLSNIQEIEEENDMEEFVKDNGSDKDSSTNSSFEDISLSSDSSNIVKLTDSIFVWGSNEDAFSKIKILGSVKIPKGNYRFDI